jgi:hypothetical protein
MKKSYEIQLQSSTLTNIAYEGAVLPLHPPPLVYSINKQASTRDIPLFTK